MNQCRICSSSYESFISFGQMPIANGFLVPEQFAGEFFYEMEVGYCEKCGMVQLIEQPDREQMFNEHYHFFLAHLNLWHSISVLQQALHQRVQPPGADVFRAGVDILGQPRHFFDGLRFKDELDSFGLEKLGVLKQQCVFRLGEDAHEIGA